MVRIPERVFEDAVLLLAGGWVTFLQIRRKVSGQTGKTAVRIPVSFGCEGKVHPARRGGARAIGQMTVPRPAGNLPDLLPRCGNRSSRVAVTVLPGFDTTLVKRVIGGGRGVACTDTPMLH